MAKRKLSTFSADEADDVFTPSVKTIKGAPLEEEAPAEKAKKQKRTQQPVKKVEKPKVEKSPKPAPPEEVKPEAVVPPAPKPEASVVQNKDAAMNEMISAQAGNKSLVQDEGDEGGHLIQLVGFCLADEEFGVNIHEVHEINRTVEITPVPRTPDFVEGVINLRGKVIPVINMRTRFRLPAAEKTNQTRIVIVEVESKIVGMMVDSVSEVLRISSNTIEPPPDILSGIDTENIQGVVKLDNRLLILLDLSKVLSNVDTRKGETA